jgi:hypothetical protein
MDVNGGYPPMVLAASIRPPATTRTSSVSSFSEKALPKPPKTVAEEDVSVEEQGAFDSEGGHAF